jgi:rhodanese-related sulfurtransferase
MENETVQESISVAELGQLLNQSTNEVFVIDLMGPADYANKHIPGAFNIPVEELETRFAEIPRDKAVVVACKMGFKKSEMALEQLHKAGFSNAKKLTGGTVGWFDSAANT